MAVLGHVHTEERVLACGAGLPCNKRVSKHLQPKGVGFISSFLLKYARECTSDFATLNADGMTSTRYPARNKSAMLPLQPRPASAHVSDETLLTGSSNLQISCCETWTALPSQAGSVDTGRTHLICHALVLASSSKQAGPAFERATGALLSPQSMYPINLFRKGRCPQRLTDSPSCPSRTVCQNAGHVRNALATCTSWLSPRQQKQRHSMDREVNTCDVIVRPHAAPFFHPRGTCRIRPQGISDSSLHFQLCFDCAPEQIYLGLGRKSLQFVQRVVFRCAAS